MFEKFFGKKIEKSKQGTEEIDKEKFTNESFEVMGATMRNIKEIPEEKRTEQEKYLFIILDKMFRIKNTQELFEEDRKKPISAQEYKDKKGIILASKGSWTGDYFEDLTESLPSGHPKSEVVFDIIRRLYENIIRKPELTEGHEKILEELEQGEEKRFDTDLKGMDLVLKKEENGTTTTSIEFLTPEE